MNIQKIGNVEIDLDDVAFDIYHIAHDLNFEVDRNNLDEDNEEHFLDIRMQVTNDYKLHWGDSCYDTDHRGNWGACMIFMGCTMAQAEEAAKDLFDQCDEMFAENEVE